MHDARTLLDLGEEAVTRLARRGYTLDLTVVAELFERRNVAIKSSDALRSESKKISGQFAATAKAGGDTAALRQRSREISDEIDTIDADKNKVEAELHDLLLRIPNFPAEDTPDGLSEDFNVEIRRHGTPPSFSFTPRDHIDLGEGLGILDFARSAKLSGSRFSVARGPGAALERALATFFVTLHTSRHGYQEVSVPYLVSRSTMTGTGQLPKFEEDLFRTTSAEKDLFLVPTAEVPLTNLHADEVLATETLPFGYTASTPCFRSEAGSYGRDTRGLIRLHQFNKVEMVRFARPEHSRAELELMLGHAETCLRELGLAYRVVKLAAGDLGFAATFTYDLEVWFPSQNTYREVSSCSDCSTFQARRANIRTKTKEGKKDFAATLNGSGLPIGRTMAALLEQNQQIDGSVTIPDVLVPYTGFRRITADGTTES